MSCSVILETREIDVCQECQKRLQDESKLTVYLDAGEQGM